MGVWVGGSLGYKDDGQLPNITGGFPMQGKDMTWGAFYTYSNGTTLAGVSWGNASRTGFSAYNSSSAYSRSDNFVIPRRLNVNYIIKY